jgi:hypothetical protein
MVKDFFTLHLIPDDKILIAPISQLLPHNQNSPFFTFNHSIICVARILNEVNSIPSDETYGRACRFPFLC